MTSHSNGDGAAAARSRWTWSELQTIISAGDLHKLARSEEQEQTYCKARSKVRLIVLYLMKQLLPPSLSTRSTNSSTLCKNIQHNVDNICYELLLLQIDQGRVGVNI